MLNGNLHLGVIHNPRSQEFVWKWDNIRSINWHCWICPKRIFSRVCHSIYLCAKSHQMHAPLCMLMHLVINDSEKQIKSYFLHFSIWSKHVEVYVVRVCSDRFWKKSVHLKIALDMVQMIWTFDIFMTKLQNCKNNLVQNSDTRGTMISNGLNMTILRQL